MTVSRVLGVSALLACLLAVPRPLGAQPWATPADTGSVTIGLQRIDHTGHRVTDGTLFANGTSLNVSLFVGVDYAFTDRWSVSAVLPYVFGKYTDAAPPPPFIPFLPFDQCRCWNKGAQDVNVTARYNIVNRAFALTTSVSAGLPSHGYPYQGEAVIGRNLRELRLTVDAGQRLDAITPRLAVTGQYSYAIVKRVLDIPNNRSNVTVGASFLAAPKLLTHGELSWQRTHGGLRIGSASPSDLIPPGEVNTAERLDQHDRLLRDNSVHLGAGARYQLPRFDVFASYVEFLDGTDTHAGRALTIGISWPFELRR